MLKKILNAMLAVLRAPFDWLSSLFGGRGNGLPAPEFTPTADIRSLVADVAADQDHQETRQIDRDVFDVVLRYVKSSEVARATADLIGVPASIKATLLSMSDPEFAALKAAGTGALRKFVGGQDHGVHGVPRVDLLSDIRVVVDAPKENDFDPRLWKLRADLLAATGAEQFGRPKTFRPA